MSVTTAATHINGSLCQLLTKISDENYDKTFACCRFWVEITQTYFRGHPARILDSLYLNRGSSAIDPKSGKLIHPTAHLIVRFAKDAESDRILSPPGGGRKTYLYNWVLSQFFDQNMAIVKDQSHDTRRGGGQPHLFHADANFVAHFANIGYIKEPTIRNRILQSLISRPAKPYDHQADALIILFKLAGATFEKYADPSVVDRCFELLEGHYIDNSVKNRLVQEVIGLRNRGWEGSPPPPVLTTGKQKQENLGSPAATPVTTPLGSPSGALEFQNLKPQSPQPDPVTAPEADGRRGRKGNTRKKAWAMFQGVFGSTTRARKESSF